MEYIRPRIKKVTAGEKLEETLSELDRFTNRIVAYVIMSGNRPRASYLCLAEPAPLRVSEPGRADREIL